MVWRLARASSHLPRRTSAITLAAAVGADPGECVRVDGTAGPCGSLGPGFVDGETPAGLISGTNAVFTLADLACAAATNTPDALAVTTDAEGLVVNLYDAGTAAVEAGDLTLAVNQHRAVAVAAVFTS